MSTEEFLSERNGDAGPKKPPKMERKRSKAAGSILTLVLIPLYSTPVHVY